MRRVVARLSAADAIAGGYALAYYAWLMVREPGTPATLLIGDVSFLPLGLAVGLAFLRNARVAALDARTRLAWGILGGGALSLWLVGNTWPRLVSYFGATAYPGWVGGLEIVQHLLLLAAIILFPGRSLPPRERFRLAADIGLIVVAGFVLAFLYGMPAARRVSPASPSSVAIAQAILDWAVFVAAAIGVLQKRDVTTRGALAWLLGANTLYLSANVVLSTMPSYRLGDAVDGIWFAAWGCRWVAARYAWHRYRAAGDGRVAPSETPVTDFKSGAFAYLLVAATFAILIVRVATRQRDHLEVFAVSATVMAGLLLLRQVTELHQNRRLYEQRLAQEARFRSLVQHASDAVLVVDDRGVITYASPASARVFGRSGPLADLPLRALLPAAEAAAVLSRHGGEPAPARRVSCRLPSAPGGGLDIELVATDLRADPVVRGVVLNGRDVTERHELERQLRQAEKLDAVGHLAGGLAHDFNNVLGAIRGYTELLREDLPPSATAEADMAQIEQAVDRATIVTRKLLSFSRKQAVQRRVIELNAVMADLEPLLRQLLTDRIDVRTSYAADLWPVRADAGQMEQVVINLATNARDAMPNGGCLWITTENRTLPVADPATGSLAAGDYVALIVSDEGVGIADSVRPRIFEPFYSTKPADRGVGLGLTMVFGIVTREGGHITVHSEPGRGSTFTVLLPRAAAAPSRAAAGAEGQPRDEGASHA